MLGKIFKYELKLTMYEVIAVTVLTILAGALCPLLIRMDVGIITFFAVSLYIVILFGAAIWTLVLFYRIFYKSMFDDEGYLTNVIPAKASSLVIGKIIAAIVLAAILYIAIVISLSLFFVILVDMQNLIQILYFFNEAIGYAFESGIGFGTFFNISLFILTMTFSSMVIFFFASALFNTFKTRRFKFIIIFILYLAISQAVSTIAQIPMRGIMNNIVQDNALVAFNLSIAVTTGIYALFIVGIVWTTVYIVNKKVDIQ